MVNARPIVAAVASVLGFAENRVYGSSSFYYRHGVLPLTDAAVQAERRGLKGRLMEACLRPVDEYVVYLP